MFDRFAWRWECYDHHLFGSDDEDELDDEEFWTNTAEEPHEAHIDHDETLPDGEAPFLSWTP
jgi:hypothetical protein